jgi:hypothetical protein
MTTATPPKKRGPGRPSKLTTEITGRVLSAIRCGAPNKVACEAAGIAEETMYGWLRRADDEPGSEYSEFSEQLKRARQEGIAARLAIIQKASTRDWRAAAWLLERDLPDTYSMKFRIEHQEAPFTLAEALARIRERRDDAEPEKGVACATHARNSGNGHLLTGGSG